MFKEGHLLYNVLMIPLQKNLNCHFICKIQQNIIFQNKYTRLVTVKQQHFAGISDTLSY